MIFFRRYWQLIIGLPLSGIVLFGFQNCSPTAFNLADEQGSGSLFSLSADQSLVAKGTTEYGMHCASCHGSLAQTTVPVASISPTALKTAINTRNAMASLRPIITDDMMRNISAALEKTLTGSTSTDLFPPLTFTCSNSATRGAANKDFRRLYKYEVVNTLTDLLGADVMTDAEVIRLLAQIGNDEVTGTGAISHHPAFAPSLFAIGRRAGVIMMSNTTYRTRFLGTCGNDATLTDACVQNFIQTFGLRAYRRPVAAEQVTAIMTMFRAVVSKNGNNAAARVLGAQSVMHRLLNSPYMGYHVETGTMVTGNRVRLDEYEIASRLSYRLTASMPDAALLQAASTGQLQTLDGIRQQAARLLQTTRGRQLADSFFSSYARLGTIDAPNQFVARLLNVSLDNIQAEMREEALAFIRNVVWNRSGDFRTLVTSSEVFPLSDRMARILETTRTTAQTPVMTNKLHSGLFLRPALLSSSAVRTDIIHRGLNFRKYYMCSLGKGSPPAGIQAAAEGIRFETMTNREGVHRMTGSTACVGCHKVFNPVGYLLERHNQLGMVRQTEPLFDMAGNLVREFPIETAVDRPYLDRDNDSPLSDAGQMIDKFANNDDMKACFAIRAFNFYAQKAHKMEDDGCTLSEINERVRGNQPLTNVIETSVANEDIFWKGI